MRTFLWCFQNNLSSPYYREKFEALLSNVSLSPVELAKSIKLLLLENTKTSCLREKKTVNDDNSNSQPWFDSECNMKKHLVILVRMLELMTHSPSLKNIILNHRHFPISTLLTLM